MQNVKVAFCRYLTAVYSVETVCCSSCKQSKDGKIWLGGLQASRLKVLEMSKAMNLTKMIQHRNPKLCLYNYNYFCCFFFLIELEMLYLQSRKHHFGESFGMCSVSVFTPSPSWRERETERRKIHEEKCKWKMAPVQNGLTVWIHLVTMCFSDCNWTESQRAMAVTCSI